MNSILVYRDNRLISNITIEDALMVDSDKDGFTIATKYTAISYLYSDGYTFKIC